MQEASMQKMNLNLKRVETLYPLLASLLNKSKVHKTSPRIISLTNTPKICIITLKETEL